VSHSAQAKECATRRQLEVLRAYIATGSIAAAAYELGISETTARQHLSGSIGGPAV
jgi:molybdenum-dependent DNA-binding transcriptional regulator ModE